jgi:hypothetical protein
MAPPQKLDPAQANNIDARAAALADEFKAQCEAQSQAQPGQPVGAQAIPPELLSIGKDALVVLIKFLITRLGG